MGPDRRWLAWLLAVLLGNAQMVLAGHGAEHAGDGDHHHADCELCLLGGGLKHAKPAASSVTPIAVANARRLPPMACPVADRGAPRAIARGPPRRQPPEPFLARRMPM